MPQDNRSPLPGEAATAKDAPSRGRAQSGLYVHVPFCVRKCGYCDFYSIEQKEGRAGTRLYLDGIEQELALLPADFIPETAYIGGGTPTSLDAEALAHLLELIRARFPAARPFEYTCEVNPGTIDAEKCAVLAESGINRLSVGAQSFDNGTLAFLGRIHGVGEIDRTLELLRSHGFDNIGLDLMYGLPEEARQRLAGDVAELLAREPRHVAAYCLTYEEGTLFEQRLRANSVHPLDDDGCRDQYELIRRMFEDSGHLHYEISNFARPGFECRHNMIYWQGGDYLGIGPAAHSFRGGRRHANPAYLAAWLDGVRAGGQMPCQEPPLEPKALAREMLVMGLRMTDGVNLDDFRLRYGFSLGELYDDEISELVELGFLIKTADRVRLAEDAFFVSNALFERLI